jgi:hypothetical protein
MEPLTRIEVRNDSGSGMDNGSGRAQSRGRCVIANTDIPSGTRILCEPPFLVVPTNRNNEGSCPAKHRFTAIETQMLEYAKSIGVSFNGTSVMLAARLVTQFLQSPRSSRIEACITSLCTDTPYAQNDIQYQDSLRASAQILRRLVENTVFSDPQLRSSATVKKKWSAIDDQMFTDALTKAGLNSFSIGDNVAVALYLEASAFNHDCDPNAVQSFDDPTLDIMIHATRDIQVGEEITISYINTGSNRPHWIRRAELLQSHHFLCCCESCMTAVATSRTCALGDFDNCWLCPECKNHGREQRVYRMTSVLSSSSVKNPTPEEDDVDIMNASDHILQSLQYLIHLRHPSAYQEIHEPSLTDGTGLASAQTPCDLAVSLLWLVNFNAVIKGIPYPDADLLMKNYDTTNSSTACGIQRDETLYICPLCYSEIEGSLYYGKMMSVQEMLAATVNKKTMSKSSVQDSAALNLARSILSDSSATLKMIEERVSR